MKHKIIFYCPDQHISYNLHTLDDQGVGGGITSRIRMAHALAMRGHSVSIFCNCPNDEIIEDVHYQHFSQLEDVESNIFIASTSGSGLDLSALEDVEITAEIQILMVHGVEPPNGVNLEIFDYIYALSNFLRDLVEFNWKVDPHKIFVSHRGVKGDYYKSGETEIPKRDPYAILYAGHPSKGLDAAIKVLRLLRKRNSRYSLHIYGGHRLWGSEEKPIREEPGVYYHGLIGQRELAHRMQACSYSLNLQAREEPFGMVIIESMRAGCIVLASNVGAFPELVQHGYNGFLIKGNPLDVTTQFQASHVISALEQRPSYRNYIKRNAITSPPDWNTIAAAWEEHWDWILGNKPATSDHLDLGTCSKCGANWLPLADGLHCTGCGRYRKS